MYWQRLCWKIGLFYLFISKVVFMPSLFFVFLRYTICRKEFLLLKTANTKRKIVINNSIGIQCTNFSEFFIGWRTSVTSFDMVWSCIIISFFFFFFFHVFHLLNLRFEINFQFKIQLGFMEQGLVYLQLASFTQSCVSPKTFCATSVETGFLFFFQIVSDSCTLCQDLTIYKLLSCTHTFN